MSKIRDCDVLIIYFSEKRLEDLATEYSVGKGQIQEIKRKISFRNITKGIKELPGYYTGNKKVRRCIPIDLIPEIYYATGDYAYFWEKFGASRNVVISIKRKRSYRKITNALPGDPGQIKRYKLTNSDVVVISDSTATSKELSDTYGVSEYTINNIRENRTRRLFIDDF